MYCSHIDHSHTVKPPVFFLPLIESIKSTGQRLVHISHFSFPFLIQRHLRSTSEANKILSRQSSYLIFQAVRKMSTWPEKTVVCVCEYCSSACIESPVKFSYVLNCVLCLQKVSAIADDVLCCGYHTHTHTIHTLLEHVWLHCKDEILCTS